MRYFYWTLIFVAILASALQAQTSDDRLQKLEKICEEQAKQIQELEGRLLSIDEESKAYTQKIVDEYLGQGVAEEDFAGITAGYENGFFVRAAEGDFEFKFTGYLQAGGGFFENNTADNNGFFLNGVRTNFDVYLYKDWHARFSVEFSNIGKSARFRSGTYGVALRDAYIEYLGIPEFSLRIGQGYIPFTMRGQYAENEQMTIFNDPFIHGWAHGRDIGFMLHGIIQNKLGYKAGIFNGEGVNTANVSDDVLMAGQLRYYYCGFKENAQSFLHVGVMRNREGLVAPGNVNSASLFAPWGRTLFSGGAGPTDSAAQGWKTAVDVAFRFDRDFEGGHNIRIESEFMYSEWQRDWDDAAAPPLTGRFSWLRGYGALFGILYRHSLTPDIKGSGILMGFNFSYSDIDNKDSSHDGLQPNPNNIRGQRVFAYTAILGYAFSKHVRAAFNWVIMDLSEKTYYGTSKDNGDSGSLEQAWFFQVTAQW